MRTNHPVLSLCHQGFSHEERRWVNNRLIDRGQTVEEKHRIAFPQTKGNEQGNLPCKHYVESQMFYRMKRKWAPSVMELSSTDCLSVCGTSHSTPSAHCLQIHPHTLHLPTSLCSVCQPPSGRLSLPLSPRKQSTKLSQMSNAPVHPINTLEFHCKCKSLIKPDFHSQSLRGSRGNKRRWGNTEKKRSR